MWNVFVIDPVSADSFLANEEPLPLYGAMSLVESMSEMGLLFLLSRCGDSLLPLRGHVFSFDGNGFTVDRSSK